MPPPRRLRSHSGKRHRDEPDRTQVYQELRHPGVTLPLLWKEYRSRWHESSYNASLLAPISKFTLVEADFWQSSTQPIRHEDDMWPAGTLSGLDNQKAGVQFRADFHAPIRIAANALNEAAEALLYAHSCVHPRREIVRLFGGGAQPAYRT